MGAKVGGGGGKRGRRGGGVMADINVTPMVDVMLVLLIIFMVAAPLMTAGVQVNLPKTQAKSMNEPDNAPLEISLDAKGGIYIGDTKFTPEKFSAKIQAVAAEALATEKRVYIRADQKLDYGKVMGIMSEINAAGFTKIALVTDPAGQNK